MQANKKITIVGAHGQMGILFAHYFANLGHTVKKLDRDDWQQAEFLLKDSDMVLVAVPIDKTIEVIERLAPYLTDNMLLVDITSIKSQPIKAMLKAHKGAVLGLHPMFGATINSAVNQAIIYCEGRNIKQAEWLIKALADLGFSMKKMDADKHDSLMNFIQGIEHFTTIALGLFLKDHQIDIHELESLASPIYRVKLLLLGRIFDQDPALYADILLADKNRVEAISAYLNQAEKLAQQLAENKRDEIIQQFKEVKIYLGDFTQLGQNESDKLLNYFYANKK